MMPVDLNQLVDDTLKLYARRAAAGHSCESSGSWRRALPAVRLDAEQIRQVIINLVDNADGGAGRRRRRRRGRTATGR